MSLRFYSGLAFLTLFLAPPAARADEPGFLGVTLSEVPEALSAHIKGAEGVLVSKVVPGGPAEKAGLKRFDVIVSANGAPVKSPEELRGRIQEAKPGDRVKLGVLRGTESLDLEATLAAHPAELPELKPEVKTEHEEVKHEEPAKGFLGVGPAEVPPVLAYHLGLAEGTGVVVGDVWKGSPAEKAGIETKDVLAAIDGKAIGGTNDFLRALSEKKAGDRVKIEFIHKGEKKSVEVTLDPRPKDLPRVEQRLDWLDSKNWPDFFGPRSSHRGRIILRNPDGSEHVFQLPDAIWKADDLFKDLEGKLGEFKDIQIPELKKSLRESLRELEQKLKDDGRGDAQWSHSESRSSVVRSIDGEYDVTVKDQNGVRTVTVLKGGKSLASDLPYEKLDTLAPEVKDRVQKAVESLKIGPAPKGVIPHLDEENRIRA